MEQTMKQLICCRKVIVTTISVVLLSLSAQSQYTPQYSQLIKTLEFVNPGYNASKVDPSVTLLYRNQWIGFTGAPKTYGAAVNVPVSKWHTGFGMATVAETRGLITQLNTLLNANVDVKISDASYLAFGLSGGVETKRIDMERAVYIGDHFAAEDFNSNNFYTGIGLNLFASDLHLGAAFHYTTLEGNNYDSNEYYSIYMNGSYLINIADDWALKPSLVYRHFAGFNDLDLGLFVLYKDLIWAGMAYRIDNAVIVFADVKLNKYLRLGYSYDMGVGSISNVHSGSHEVSLEFTLPRNKKQFERIVQ
jgi:type IX secretion system PorP/SprF family membrane protein